MNIISRYISQQWQNRVSIAIQLLSFIISVLFIAAAIIDYGFNLNSEEMGYLQRIYHFVQYFFVVIFTGSPFI